jgi:hypothetical protein
MTLVREPSRHTAGIDTGLQALQHEVQRKLGRCMLRLQQYERLLKALIASTALEGPVEELSAVRARQVAGASDKSLGTLVRMFTASHLTSEASRGEVDASGASNGDKSPDAAWASMRFSISMPPQRHEQTKVGLAELVALRNDLVHHLIERFDISNDSGCSAASNHLDNCYEQIDGHCRLLTTWAASLTESQALASSFLASKAFEDAFVHGISPDGSVCWPRSTIVECLRRAETACQADGWTPLDVAIRLISKGHRDQIPSRYGCRTWRQVLKQSGQFEVRSVSSSSSGTGHAWYRSNADPEGQRHLKATQ